jgi:DNA-binding response OmpR family regulator
MKGKKVLLADDETIFLRNLTRLLLVRGFDVVSVEDGKSAIKTFEANDFDVVVLDLRMPGIDGISALKEMKKLGRLTETLILTGHGSDDSRREALDLGAFDYLAKPLDLDLLLARIEAAAGKKSIREKKATLDQMIRMSGI